MLVLVIVCRCPSTRSLIVSNDLVLKKEKYQKQTYCLFSHRSGNMPLVSVLMTARVVVEPMV